MNGYKRKNGSKCGLKLIGPIFVFAVLLFPNSPLPQAEPLSDADHFKYFAIKYSSALNLDMRLVEDCQFDYPFHDYNEKNEQHVLTYCPKKLRIEAPGYDWCNEDPDKWIAILVGHELSHGLLTSDTRLLKIILQTYNLLDEKVKKQIDEAYRKYVARTDDDAGVAFYLDDMVMDDYHAQVDGMGIKLAMTFSDIKKSDIECFIEPIREHMSRKAYRIRKRALTRSLKEGDSDFSDFYSFYPLRFDTLTKYYRSNARILSRISRKNTDQDNKRYLMTVFNRLR